VNTCFNAVDRHVAAGRGEQAALIYDSPVTNQQQTLNYRELLTEVGAFAGALKSYGVGKGDRVVIYMPMVPQAVIAMLACARIGAIHSVVFGGFAAAELAARLDDATPTVVVSASCGVEPTRLVDYGPLLDRALALSQHQPRLTIMLQRPMLEAALQNGPWVEWTEAVRLGRAAPADCEPVTSSDPLYILYTSGTTGKPKGIVRDNGGHAVAMAWSMPNIFDLQPGEVWWTASDIGWVVGHSYIVYGPLIAGATTVLYEGKPVGTPDAGAFWRVIADHGVTALFTAPTAIRAIRREDSEAAELSRYDISSLRNLFLAGERLDPDTFHWAQTQLEVPVIDNWWQTETGWPIAANLRGLGPMPAKAGSPSVPVPGFNVQVLTPDASPAEAGVEGTICLKLPLPPGSLTTVWNDDELFQQSYLTEFPGFYVTGDSGYLDSDGYLFVMGRLDDVINVAGHRISTGGLEALVAAHPAVAECAVIGVRDRLKGQVPRAFVVLRAGVDIDPADLQREIVRLVRDGLGPVSAFANVDVVTSLPKTRSGKILRKVMREIADGRVVAIPSTIDNPEILDYLRPILSRTDP
jgi:propionyl-CoA synthetase